MGKTKAVTRTPVPTKETTETQPSKNRGWIKFHRSELEWLMGESSHLLKVWLWCRTRATHKKRTYRVTHPKRKTIEVELQVGQFVFGKYRAAENLGMAPSTFRDQIMRLQELGKLKLESDRNHTLATLVKWDIYESDGEVPDRKKDLKSKDKKLRPQKQKTSDRKTKKARPQSETEKAGDSNGLDGDEKEPPTAKEKKPDRKNKKAPTVHNNKERDKRKTEREKQEKGRAEAQPVPEPSVPRLKENNSEDKESPSATPKVETKLPQSEEPTPGKFGGGSRRKQKQIIKKWNQRFSEVKADENRHSKYYGMSPSERTKKFWFQYNQKVFRLNPKSDYMPKGGNFESDRRWAAFSKGRKTADELGVRYSVWLDCLFIWHKENNSTVGYPIPTHTYGAAAEDHWKEYDKTGVGSVVDYEESLFKPSEYEGKPSQVEHYGRVISAVKEKAEANNPNHEDSWEGDTVQELADAVRFKKLPVEYLGEHHPDLAVKVRDYNEEMAKLVG